MARERSIKVIRYMIRKGLKNYVWQHFLRSLELHQKELTIYLRKDR